MTFVTHNLGTRITDSTLWSYAGSDCSVIGGALTPTDFDSFAGWKFVIPGIVLPTDGSEAFVEITFGDADWDMGTGKNIADLRTIASIDPGVESGVTDDFEEIQVNFTTDHQAGAVWTLEVGPACPDDPSFASNYSSSVIGNNYVYLMFAFAGGANGTVIHKIRTENAGGGSGGPVLSAVGEMTRSGRHFH